MSKARNLAQREVNIGVVGETNRRGIKFPSVKVRKGPGKKPSFFLTHPNCLLGRVIKWNVSHH